MTNYGGHLVLAIFMVIAFFFVLIFSVTYEWFDFLEDEKFDPEEHVCIANYGKCSLALIDSGELYCQDDCRDWRPKNECEKGNPEYQYVNEVKSDGEYLYYTGGKVCALKMKAPNSAKIGSMSVK